MAFPPSILATNVHLFGVVLLRICSLAIFIHTTHQPLISGAGYTRMLTWWRWRHWWWIGRSKSRHSVTDSMLDSIGQVHLTEEALLTITWFHVTNLVHVRRPPIFGPNIRYGLTSCLKIHLDSMAPLDPLIPWPQTSLPRSIHR